MRGRAGPGGHHSSSRPRTGGRHGRDRYPPDTPARRAPPRRNGRRRPALRAGESEHENPLRLARDLRPGGPPAYRDAKVRTLLATAEEVLGPSGEAPALRLADDAGREYRDPAVVLVSNNPYALDNPLAPGTRPALDTGRLGIVVLDAPGEGRLPPGRAWTAPRLEVSAPAGGTRRGRRRGGGPQPAAAVRHPAGRAAGPDLLAPSGRVAIGAPPPPRPPAPAARQPGLTT